MLFFLPFLSTPPIERPDMTRMVVGIILFLGLVVLCYALMKWLSNRSFSMSRGIYLKVIDRMIVARDVQIAVIRAGDRLFAVGITKEGVTLITELDEEDLAPVREAEKTGFISDLLSRGRDSGKGTKKTFLRRFGRNLSILSGFAQPGEKFDVPDRAITKNNTAEAENSAVFDAAFKDVLIRNQERYERETDDNEEPEAREYEFKERDSDGAAQKNSEINQDLNPVQKPRINGGSGQSAVMEEQSSEGKKGNPAVNMSNYTDAIEKMKSFGDMGVTGRGVPENEQPIKKINEAISRADKLSEPEETIESVLRSVSKRKEKYRKR